MQCSSYVLDFEVANISVRKTHIFVGDNMSIICAVSETQTEKPLYMYLCKNGAGVSMKIAQAKEEVNFTFNQVRREDSGNYSCVYSTKECHPGNISLTHEIYTTIQVTGNIILIGVTWEQPIQFQSA